MSIETKVIKQTCFLCCGKKKKGKKVCSKCNGTGKTEDVINYFIDDKNKICVDGDTLK